MEFQSPRDAREAETTGSDAREAELSSNATVGVGFCLIGTLEKGQCGGTIPHHFSFNWSDSHKSIFESIYNAYNIELMKGTVISVLYSHANAWPRNDSRQIPVILVQSVWSGKSWFKSKERYDFWVSTGCTPKNTSTT